MHDKNIFLSKNWLYPNWTNQKFLDKLTLLKALRVQLLFVINSKDLIIWFQIQEKHSFIQQTLLDIYSDGTG